MTGSSTLLLILLTSLAAGPDTEGRRPGIDVEHYRFEIAVSDSSNVIHGQAEVSVLFDDDVDAFFLDLVGQDGGATGMEVAAVRQDGAPVAFEHADNRLNILYDGARGDRATFVIHYSGEPADGLVISSNKFGSRTFFGDNWPNRARHWLPTVDHVSEKATVEWVVTAPAHYQVVANGKLIEETGIEANRRMTHWRTRAPLPPKVMVVGIAEFAVQHLRPVQEIPVQTWVYPGDRDAGFHDFAVARPMLRYFVEQIGEYPYAKLANVESTTRYGGMENASAIFYAEQGVTGRRTNEATVAHEIAHQWFGNSATEGDWHHIWLSEGFATYFTDLYWEHAYGRDRMENRLKRNREVVLRYHNAQPDAPVVDTRISDLNQLLSPNSYQKGGWVLHMLRNEIGTEAFWEGIRAYYHEFRDSNALTDDLRRVMEDVSGQALEFFFDQWIFRPGQPVIDGTWQQSGSVVAVELRQTQDDLFNFPLTVEVETDGGVVRNTFRVAERTESVEIEAGGTVRNVRLDPDVNLLFVNNFRGSQP